MFSKWFAGSVTLIGGLFVLSLSYGGNEGPHAGDAYAFEFMELGTELAEYLSRPEFNPLLQAHKIDLEGFKRALNRRVYSYEPEFVMVNNNVVDAVNFDTEPTRVNRLNWRRARLIQKLKAVFHEYLGVMGIERDNYNVSIYFIKMLEDLAQKLLTDQNSPNLFYGVCVASPPITYVGPTCQGTEPWFKSAEKCAEQAARQNCELDRRIECSPPRTFTREVKSKHMAGIEFCEVTVIVK